MLSPKQNNLNRTLSSIEKGTILENITPASLLEPSTYKIVTRRSTNKHSRKTNISQPNPAAIEATRKIMKNQHKIAAANKIKGQWKEYKRRHPKESAFQTFIKTTKSTIYRTLSRLSTVKGGKKTRKQKRKKI